jgi:hypothetical protein
MFQKESIQAAFDRYVDQFDRATPGSPANSSIPIS